MPRNFGVSGVDDQTADALDELKREWDAAEAGTVSRSDVAREALAMGVAMLELDAFKPAGGHWSTQERKAIARQAGRDHFHGDE